MPLCSLPQEIIDQITDNLSQSQAHILARTSRRYREATMPCWAGSAALWTRERFLAFCESALEHDDRPMLYMRRISCTFKEDAAHAEDALKLSKVVEKVPGLGSLNLSLASRWLAASSELKMALVNHPNLTEVYLEETQEERAEKIHAVHVLSFTASQLRSVSILDYAPGPDLSRALVPHSDSLHTLSLCFLPQYNNPNTVPRCTAIFPFVHTLSIHSPTCAVLESLAPAFPNVVSFAFFVNDCAMGHDHSESILSWQHLDHLEYSAPFFLDRPVRRLSICDGLSTLHGTVDRESQCNMAQLFCECVPLVMTAFLHRDVAALVANYSPQVKFLHFNALDYWRNDFVDLFTICDKETMISAAEALREVKLEALFFSCRSRRREWLAFDEAFNSEELVAIAMTIAELIPTLTSVGFEAGWLLSDQIEHHCVVSWFHIVRTDTSTSQLYKLSASAADIHEWELFHMRR